MKQTSLAKYAAEFIGTLILVFTIGCNVHTGSVAAAVSVGSALTALVYTLGPISGGHLNPAVTFALALAGYDDLSRRDAAFYMIFQVLGGIAGAVLYLVVLGNALLVQPVGLYSGPQASAIEIIYSIALCYVVLGVVAGGPNAHFGLAIGTTVTSAAIAGGPISGCCLNPAVAAGSIVVAGVKHGSVALHYHWMYLTSPFFGAALAAFCFALAGGNVNSEDHDVRNMFKQANAWPPEDPMMRSGYGSMPVSYRSGSPTESQGPASTLRVVAHSPLTLPIQVVTHQMFCGCSWQMRDKSRGDPEDLCDIDLSCAVLNQAGDCLGAVYFATECDENGLEHSGDAISGKSPRKTGNRQRVGTNDNEVIRLKLSDVKSKVHALIFVVTIFGKNHESFGDVQQMCIRLVDVDMGDREICRFEKQDLHLQANALIAAMLYRQGNSWVFKAVDESYWLDQEHQSYRALHPQLKELVRKEVARDPSLSLPPVRGVS